LTSLIIIFHKFNTHTSDSVFWYIYIRKAETGLSNCRPRHEILLRGSRGHWRRGGSFVNHLFVLLLHEVIDKISHKPMGICLSKKGKKGDKQLLHELSLERYVGSTPSIHSRKIEKENTMQFDPSQCLSMNIYSCT
jgi:hypothetical protein